MHRRHNEDPDAITAYPRQRAASLSHAPSNRYAVPVQGSSASNKQVSSLGTHYMSDPALLEEGGEGGGRRYSIDSGRRSAMSMEDYSRTEETQNMERQVRKVKKKKMRHLKSFMHAFIGGLRHKDQEEDQRDIASTRDRQRHERDGLARAVAGGSSGPAFRGAEVRGDVGTRRRNSLPTSPRGGLQHRYPPPRLELQQQQQHHRQPQLRGLYNHGNTCFMNAVLQCLSNTDRLAEYFVTDTYKVDFNKTPSSSSKPPPAAAPVVNVTVTEQFALLLKCLWSGQYNPVVSSRFKEVVGRAAEQYQGAAQHDAQEFFLWLLDNIHEDLNQAAARRYKPLKVRVCWREGIEGGGMGVHGIGVV